MNTMLRPLGLTVAALALGSGLLVGCGDDTDPVAADPSASPEQTGSAPTESPSTGAEPTPTPEGPTTSGGPDGPDSPDSPDGPDGSGSTDAPAGSGTTVPVYFVGDSPTGPRLYREFRRVEGDSLTEGVALLVSGDALDPDYTTLLPALDIVSIEEDQGATVVTLGADSPTSDKALTRRESRLAVQSLVYTVQGITQSRAPLRVTVQGQPTPLLGQPTDTGVRAAAPLRVLSLVNVTSPTSDEQVADTLAASGVASSFEATVPWEIRDDSGTVVLDGFATAEGFMDRLYPWQTDIDVSSLDPGSYTFAALTADSSSGEGPGPYEDTKAVTIG